MILRSGDKLALRVGGEGITYKELIQKVHLFSGQLQNKQGRAIIFSENRAGWVYAFYAAWEAGMIPVPVDYLSVASDLRYIIDDCKPSVVFCSSARKATLDEALQDSNQTLDIIVFDLLESQEANQLPPVFQLNEAPGATAVIIYTSGTTGKAKGVMLSFQNLQANIDSVCTHIDIFRPEDVTLMLLPLHHIFPLLGTMIMPLWVGCTIAVSPSMAPEDIISTICNNRVSIIVSVPRFYVAIRKSIMDKVNKSLVARALFGLSRVVNSLAFSHFLFTSVHKKFGGNMKYLVSGGAALDSQVYRDFRTLGFNVIEGYGMTEAAPMISFSHPGKTRKGSTGFFLSCVKGEVRDNEIVISGPNVMQGYFGKPGETAEVIKDGWLHTGDLGHVDGKGYVYLTGRKKEIMVLSNGKNINPSEIEEKLQEMSPVIREAGVFQVGDRICAIVVPNKQEVLAQQIDDVHKYLVRNVLQPYNQSVAPYKMIVELHVSHDELPRTQLGKIKRFMLPSLAVEKQQTEFTEEVTMEEYRILRDYFMEEKKIAVQPGHHLVMNLGLDSLDRVSLQVFIESSFGVVVEVEQLLLFENILQLSEHIHEHKKRTSIEKINWSLILKQKIHLKLPATWITSNIAVKVSHLLFTIFFRFRSKGAINIPEEPCIIVANHQSFLDGLIVASNLKFAQMHHTFFYAKEKHMRNPLLKYFANRNNIIIMDLNHNLKESIQKMAEVLKSKKNLIIFPEGTRTTDGSIGDFKKTFAILSRELNVPIVPVSIHGAFEAMPRGRFFPIPFSMIKVEYLTPVYPENYSYDMLSDKVRTLIQRKHNIQKG